MVWLVFGLIGICILFLLSFLKKITSNDTSVLFHKIEHLWGRAKKLGNSVSYKYGNINSKKKNELIKEIKRSYDNIQKNYERIISYKIDNINNGERWIVDNINIIEKEYKLLLRSFQENSLYNLPVYVDNEKNDFCKYPRILINTMHYVKNMKSETTKDTIISEFQSRGKRSRLSYREINFLKASLSFSLIQGISELTREIALMAEEEEYAAVIFNQVKEKEIDEKAFFQLVEDYVCKNKFFFINKILISLKEESENNIYLFNIFNGFRKISNVNEEGIALKIKEFMARNEEKAQIYLKSLNFIDKIQWESFIGKMSYVENTFYRDPAGVYSKMDLETKKMYRRNIENLSRKLKKSEFEIIDLIIKKCKKSKNKIESHVGYYLIDEGRKEVLKEYNKRELRMSKNRKTKVYITAVSLITVVFILCLLRGVYLIDSEKKLLKYIIPFIILIPSFSQLALTLINWGISLCKNPEIIPKIDYSKGIDVNIKTCVVIPCMFNKKEDVDELIHKMEIYYLGNKEKGVYFALLADFLDNKKQSVDRDNVIIQYSKESIRKINEKYGEKSKFNIFIRKRVFNKRDGYWMGWERKRGKLSEFNRLIRGDENTTFNVFCGEIDELKECKYIITLDEDTFLPLGGCGKLVGAMEHILNQPVYDEESKMVKRGYSLIQPRISINHESHNKTFFSRIFSGEVGFDIYTRAVSDVYQDLFKEGIFTGKGIYNIDMFENILQKEIPDYSVLSHDLIEGSFVRCGLATDIEFIDSYPSNYYSFSKRLHRWVRGDWQLLKFLKRKNLSTLNKFQIIDNMRRSLVSPSILLIMIFSLLNILPNDKGVWLVAALISYIIPVLINISELVFLKAKTYGLLYESKNYKNTIERIMILISFIPYNAYCMIDAIGRTLYRVFISNKNLLQWTPASRIEKKFVNGFRFYLREMIFAPIFAVGVMIVAYFHCVDLMIYYMFPCGLWFMSPFIAYSISKVYSEKTEEDISLEEKEYLHRIARKTWAFFEDTVKEENNYLGVDNIQVEPETECVERTSPTNIGMTLTSSICAYNLGYISIIEVIDRTEKTIESVMKLEKENGHLYNWYDVNTMSPLEPKFVSTVDSGNLISYLYLVKRFLEKCEDNIIPNKNRLSGLKDTIQLLNIQYESVLGEKNILNGAYHKIESMENGIDLAGSRKVIRYLSNILKELDGISSKQYWRMKTEEYLKSLEEEIKFFYDDRLEEKEESPNTISGLFKDNRGDAENVVKIKKRISDLIDNISEIIQKADFSTLYNKELGLFSIGYDLTNEKLSDNYYDLIASEARMTSFISIAKGDIPLQHWFKLGRNLFMIGEKRVFASWSGTTFEYLMPSLLLNDFKGSAFYETIKGVAKAQYKFGKEYNIPFGISESGYYTFDVNDNYQYKAFGVPALAMKNILNPDLVVSPYSTFLIMLAEKRICMDNIKKLREIGMEGEYGFYEAVDFTKRRMKRDKEYEIIKSFMIHHQGMTFMALDNVLNDNVLKKLFHSIPNIKSMERMLNEKIPNSIIFDNKKKSNRKIFREEKNEYIRKYRDTKLVTPEIQALSNENYRTIVSYTGKGESTKGKIALNYYNRSYVQEDGGILFFINANRDKFWSLSNVKNQNGISGEVVFKHNDATFLTNAGEVFVSYRCTLDNSEALEYRIVEVENRKKEACDIELYNYSEIILSEKAAFEAHPAFGKLFMNTFIMDDVLVCKRRGKSSGEKDLFGFTYVVGEGRKSYQSDKREIVKRGRTFDNNPEQILEGEYNNKCGDVLHPVFSQKINFKLQPGEKRRLIYCYGITEEVEDIKRIKNKLNSESSIISSIDSFEKKAFKNLEIMDVSSNNYALIMNICSKLIYQKRNKIEDISLSRLGTQQDLWKYGISGDFPIIFLEINRNTGIIHVKQLIKVYQYLKIIGVEFDLIVACKEQKGYNQPLREAVFNSIEELNVGEFLNVNGGIYIKNYHDIKDDIGMFQYVSSLMFNEEEGPLFVQIPFEKREVVNEADVKIHKFISSSKEAENREKRVKFYNGYGGFKENDKSYRVYLEGEDNTPTPWCNVVSGDNMGFVVSERGTMYSWYDNSREFKITPWNNDEVSDLGGEYIYITDIDKKKIFSITKAPFEDGGKRTVIHGLGYSKFNYEYGEISFSMKVYMNNEYNIKHISISGKNKGKSDRRFKVSYFANLVLGVHERDMQRYIRTTINKEKEYMYADNPYNTFFNRCKVFLKVLDGENIKFTGDRYEVLKGGSVANPLGIISDKVFECDGFCDNNCMFEQSDFYIRSGEEKKVEILLGAGESIEEIEKLMDKYSLDDLQYEEIRNEKFWSDYTNKIQVETPEESFNIMMNSWLIYQVLSCRFKGRTAFYQSGGAYGFRDQLQDLMPIIYFDKDVVREYILLSSEKMFKEGDVLHWWHERINSGIRTRFSDDLVWLPYAVARYIKITGDRSILLQRTTFIAGDELGPEENERYGIYEKSEESASIVDKCLKIIRRAFSLGSHGLPLMGCGDWNDGMNNVGVEGKGESVWLAEFLYHTVDEFSQVCREEFDYSTIEEMETMKEKLKKSVDENAWDGEWFKRGFFDNGEPLGSKDNEDCKIDMISQAWSVISGIGSKKKCTEAMNSAEKYLIDYETGIIKLLQPAFAQGKEEPGYIKGYIKGVRENGGQYTHGVVWGVIANNLLGENEKALELFSMLNPISKTLDIDKCRVYGKEPYVMCGDVYSDGDNNGYGGWSWYTGSAAWMYRCGLENILGFNIEGGEKIFIKPNMPQSWKEFKIKYKYEDALYNILVKRGKEYSIILNGNKVKEDYIQLNNTGEYQVVILV